MAQGVGPVVRSLCDLLDRVLVGGVPLGSGGLTDIKRLGMARSYPILGAPVDATLVRAGRCLTPTLVDAVLSDATNEVKAGHSSGPRSAPTRCARLPPRNAGSRRAQSVRNRACRGRP